LGVEDLVVEQVRDLGRDEHRDVRVLDDGVAWLRSRGQREPDCGLAVRADPLAFSAATTASSACSAFSVIVSTELTPSRSGGE
jgi:hypothetical protein